MKEEKSKKNDEQEFQMCTFDTVQTFFAWNARVKSLTQHEKNEWMK